MRPSQPEELQKTLSRVYVVREVRERRAALNELRKHTEEPPGVSPTSR